MQDYAGYLQNFGSGITLKTLAECTTGPAEITIGQSHRKFKDCEQAMASITGKHIVKAVAAKNNLLCIELGDKGVIPNDLTEVWAKKQKEETGEDVSFF